MNTSLIYAANSNAQAIPTTGGVVNFGSVVRKVGHQVNLSGGNVVIRGEGYYDVIANLSFTAVGVSNLVISILSNGVLIPGATATITTAAGTAYSVVIPTEAKDECCGEKTITVEISNGAVNVTNAAILVETATN